MSKAAGARQRMPAADRREHLLEVARREFSVNGYRATTTLAVASAAGVSEGLVLKHFGSKQELFRAAVAEPILDVFREQITSFGPALTDVGVNDIAEGLRAFFTRLAEVVHTERALIGPLIGNLQDFPDVAAELTALLRTQVDELARITTTVSTGRDEFRALDALPLTYASLGVAAMAGLATDDPAGLVASYVDVLMLGVLTPTGRRRYRPS